MTDANWLRDLNFKEWLKANPNGTRAEYDALRAKEDAVLRQLRALKTSNKQQDAFFGIIGLFAVLFVYGVIPFAVAGVLGFVTPMAFWARLVLVYVAIFLIRVFR